MGSVSWRKRGNRYLVSWRLDDGSQGGKTVDTPDEARDLAAEKRLEMRRGMWRGRRRGRFSFDQWADDWWEVWGADPDQLLGEAKRRAFTPEEAGRLLGCVPLFWWDHVLTFLGTGLRFGELAGLRCRRVHLDRPVPVLQVVEVRYQAGGQFGSGFKARPKSDAGIRELPLAPLVIESIRRQLPLDSDPTSSSVCRLSPVGCGHDR
jgi:integrase